MNIHELNLLLRESDVYSKNRIKQIIINNLLNPAFIVDRTFTIPPIKLERMEPGVTAKLINEFKKVIPEFINDTFILPEPIPDFEKYTLHFVRKYEQEHGKYLFIFKIHLQYGGGANTVIQSQDPDKYFPGYQTNNIYYTALLVPVNEIIEKNNEIVSFQPRPYGQGKKEIEPDSPKFLGSEIFDQHDFSELNNKFIDTFYSKKGKFVPIADYYPLKYEYSTVTLNLLYPDKNTINRLLPVFDKMARIILNNEKKDILSERDNKTISDFFSLYDFTRKVNKTNVFWEVTVK